GGLLTVGRGDERTATDLLEALERGPLRPYYLLFGEETYLVERALGVVRRRLVPAAGTVRTLWADQEADQIPAALAELASPSLFGGTQVLVLRHVDGLGEEGQAYVLDALPILGSGGALVLVACAADQRRKLFGACLRAGAGVGFPALPDARAAAAWVVRLAGERGHAIAPAAVTEL